MKIYEEMSDAQKRAACEAAVKLMESPTWPYVLKFAERMEAKLAKNRHKGDRNGWINCNPDELAFRIRDELAELEDALRLVRRKENVVASEREQIANEAADVANFAMMIADIYTGKLEVSNGPNHRPPMKAALEGLLLAASKLRIRVNHHAPNLVKFSEWDELTEAMRTGERVVKSSNAASETRRTGLPPSP